MSDQTILIEVKVNAGKGCFRFYEKNSSFIIDTKSPPENNKANLEIIKELGKLYNAEIRIIKGATARRKTIEIRGISHAKTSQ